jgi:hypothetical protein
MATVKRPVKRTDPRARPIDPMEAMTRIQDADPEMRYVWAPEHGMHDVLYYESMGYEKVILTEGGPRPLRLGKSTKEGPIMQFGSILMCKSKESYADEIFDPGQAEMDAIERKIYDKDFARREISKVDGVRGMIGQESIDAVNETTPLTRGY